MATQPLTNRLWAKLIRPKPGSLDSIRRHHLLHHLIDVGVMAQSLWEEEFSSASASRLGQSIGLSNTMDLRRWIGFVAAAHDIGKAHPCFQRKDPEFREAEQACLNSMNQQSPHGEMSVRAIRDYLVKRHGMASVDAREWAVMSGGHHGTFCSAKTVKLLQPPPHPWAGMQEDLLDTLAGLFSFTACPPKFYGPGAVRLAGLISVADWIASDPRNFPFPVRSEISDIDYFRNSHVKAMEASRKLHWHRPDVHKGFVSFSSVFPSIAVPRPLQKAVEAALRDRSDLRLLVIEAPMGEGKTEAALFAAEAWSRQDGRRGFFFALPTMATANQMFSRLSQHLSQTSPEQPSHLQLLHGHALLLSEFRELLTPNIDEGEDRSVLAESWFTFRKRGLLAPFGTGTIDQILWAAIRHRHVFVRLKGLSGKTVIIDEVHAYDVYMSTLLERLLHWLAALDCRVVLLSATLPRSKRDKLVSQFASTDRQPATQVEYPLITAATAEGRTLSWTFAANAPSREIRLARIPPVSEQDALPDPWLDLLRRLENHGGCCAIICNTVKRAQQIYSAVCSLASWKDNCSLLHARFRLEDRHAIESRVLSQFGPTGQRPARHVLVATQIIEQSLDLDFDVLVTQLCPIDLLFQRIGRLHRHSSRIRPEEFSTPSVFLIGDEKLSMDRGTLAVYDEYVLLSTWLALRQKERLTLPEDIGALVEAVYEQAPSADASLQQRLDAAKSRWLAKQAAEKNRAAEIYLPPNPDGADLAEITRPSDDDELMAKTRLGEFGTAVVCLLQHEMDDLDAPSSPDEQQVRQLIGKSVTLRPYEIADDTDDATVELPQPSLWGLHPTLRGYRLLELDKNGKTILPNGATVHLDPVLGLLVGR
jgi:CRISPR-associated endonuclease/helicase Cas3